MRIKHVATDAHVTEKLGQVSTLPGENHVTGPVVKRKDGFTSRLPTALICSTLPKAALGAFGPSCLKLMNARSGEDKKRAGCLGWRQRPMASQQALGGQ